MGKATQARTTPTIHFKSLISTPDDGYVLPEFELDCVYVRFGGNRIVEGFGHGGNNGLSLGDVKSSGLEVAGSLSECRKWWSSWCSSLARD